MEKNPPDREALRRIPSVDEIIKMPSMSRMLSRISRSVLVDSIREAASAARRSLIDGTRSPESVTAESVAADVERIVGLKDRTAYPRVVNATGVVLHTGLGRAVYPDEAVEALVNQVRGYTRIAYDLTTAKRVSREEPVAKMLCDFTGAEAAQIVNNNAAATLLILNSMAKGREVVCSRGELVEIGGSFRIPEVMSMSGAVLREVGSTNKTHLKDYEKAINPATAALLRVHTSNYKIRGFTESVPLEDLVKLGRKHGIPVVDDLGSGTFYDMGRVGLVDETVVSDSISTGSDVICFSTDKLMSGPQGGVILGKKKYVDAMRDNPLKRALRVDKMTVIVLEATLKVLLDSENVWKRNPTYRMLDTPLDVLDRKAKGLKRKLAFLGEACDLAVEDEVSEVGGGATPVTEFPTRVLSAKPKSMSAGDLAIRLRHCTVPVCARVKGGAVLLDPRTILDGEEKHVIQAFREVMGAPPGRK